MSDDKTGVLGKIVQHPIDEIEVLRLDAAPDTVTAVCSEVDGLCPVTMQPDHYVVTIEYDVINGAVIESKSLKLYLWKYRDRGISCEALAATIARELRDQYLDAAGQPLYESRRPSMRVTATQQSRGGIALTATRTVGY